MKLTIATRQSPLALWQAEFVAKRLVQVNPALQIDLLPMTTRGDQQLDRSLAKIGGKGLFLKELEEALLAHRADLAVHSMKDVPTALPNGLAVGPMLARHNPCDALVSKHYRSVRDLPIGAVVGTSSLRRQSQLLARRPDLQIRPLRGNVNTRLAKLDGGEFDAIVLAAAGLERLGLADRISKLLPADRIVPAVTQGIIGLEHRADDQRVATAVAELHDADSAIAAGAERSFAAELGGNCQVPLAGFAEVNAGQLVLTGLVGAPDGQRLIRGAIAGPVATADDLGRRLARRLRERGADRILAALD